jgi:hypothetical protein
VTDHERGTEGTQSRTGSAEHRGMQEASGVRGVEEASPVGVYERPANAGRPKVNVWVLLLLIVALSIIGYLLMQAIF